MSFKVSQRWLCDTRNDVYEEKSLTDGNASDQVVDADTNLSLCLNGTTFYTRKLHPDLILTRTKLGTRVSRGGRKWMAKSNSEPQETPEGRKSVEVIPDQIEVTDMTGTLTFSDLEKVKGRYESVSQVNCDLSSQTVHTRRRGSRISTRGGRQGIGDLIWDGDERFFAFVNTDLQLFKMLIAILCLNGVEQPFKGHQCSFFLPLKRRNPRLRRGSLRPKGGRRTQRPPWIRA